MTASARQLAFAFVVTSVFGLASTHDALAQKKKEDPVVERAQKAVRKILQDPKSADFQSSRQTSQGVCGELRSKNAYGAYGEVAQYAYSTADKRAYVVFINNRHLSLKSALDAYQRICGKT